MSSSPQYQQYQHESMAMDPEFPDRPHTTIETPWSSLCKKFLPSRCPTRVCNFHRYYLIYLSMMPSLLISATESVYANTRTTVPSMSLSLPMTSLLLRFHQTKIFDTFLTLFLLRGGVFQTV